MWNKTKTLCMLVFFLPLILVVESKKSSFGKNFFGSEILKNDLINTFSLVYTLYGYCFGKFQTRNVGVSSLTAMTHSLMGHKGYLCSAIK
mgnify:CR=1 FL=1